MEHLLQNQIFNITIVIKESFSQENVFLENKVHVTDTRFLLKGIEVH